MAYEPKPGQFSLFKHDKKGNDKAPDYSGDGMDLQGSRVRVAAWLKEGNGGKFMSCRLSYPQKPSESKPSEKPDDIESDLPF